MARLTTAIRVKVIRGGKELPATVRDPHRRPWSVVTGPSKGDKTRSEEIQWDVVILLPRESEADPLIFESRREARAWAAKDPRARGFNWRMLEESRNDDDRWVSDDADVEQSNAATARLGKFVKEKGLETNLQTAIERAHEEGVLDSLTLFDLSGCPSSSEYQVVEGYLGDWTTLGKTWTPDSCQGVGQSTLYEETYGWTNPDSKLTPVCGSECRADVPHDVRSVKVEH